MAGDSQYTYPSSVPVWDRKITQQQLTFGGVGWDSATIPATASAVVMSSLESGANEFWVSPVQTAPSGMRVGGVSGQRALFRLGNGAAIEVYGNTGGSEVFGLVYFYGQPPPGGSTGCVAPLNIPVWDDRIEHEEISLGVSANDKLCIPASAKWFCVSVLETGGVNDALLSSSSSAATGLHFGGNTGNPIIHRIAQPELAYGKVTTANGAGTTLIDANAKFLSAGIQGNDTVTNQTDGSRGRVATVDSDTQITCVALAGGTQDDFDVGERYTIRQTPPIYVHNPSGASGIEIGVLYFAE